MFCRRKRIFSLLVGLMMVVGTISFGPAVVYGATDIVVTTEANDDAGSLRQALADIDSGGTITFHQDVKTITLSSPLSFEKNVNITGNTNADGTPGVTLTGSASISSRLLQLGGKDGGTSALKNLVFRDAAKGALSNNDNSLLEVDNCLFENNSGTNGGAVGLSAKATFTNSIFRNNSAGSGATSTDEGGAIRSTTSNISGTIIRNCLFEGNSAWRGGAINCNQNATFYIYNSSFINNISRNGIGSAIFTGAGSGAATAINSTFYGNKSLRSGNNTVIHVSGGVNLAHCTVVNNSGKIQAANATGTRLLNCIVAGNGGGAKSDQVNEGPGTGTSLIQDGITNTVEEIFGTPTPSLKNGRYLVPFISGTADTATALVNLPTQFADGSFELIAFDQMGAERPTANPHSYGAVEAISDPSPSQVTSAADNDAGSLRQVIAAASPGAQITIADSITTITLASNIAIDKELIIIGATDGTTISGDGGTGLFDVAADVYSNVRFENITFSNAASSRAVNVQSGNVVFAECAFAGNNGGGLVIGGGTVIAYDSNFTSNSADNGGAVCLNGGSFTAFRSKFSDNTSTTNGSAVYVSGGGVANVDESYFTANAGSSTVYVDSGVFCASNSSFFSNTGMTANTGVVYTTANGVLNFYHCTVALNGKGVYSDGKSGTVRAFNSIFASNGTDSEQSDQINDCDLGRSLGTSADTFVTYAEVFGTNQPENGYILPIAGGMAHTPGFFVSTDDPGLYFTHMRVLDSRDQTGAERPLSTSVTAGSVEVGLPDPKNVVVADSTEAALRSAIRSAMPGDTITFESGVGTINLTSTLEIDKVLTIKGGVDGDGKPLVTFDGGSVYEDPEGPTSTHPTTNGVRILNLLNIPSTLLFTIENIGFSNGYSAAEHGGAIQSSGVVLKLKNCHFFRNRIARADGHGGAVFSNATMTITDCVFRKNYTVGGPTSNNNVGYGGAVYGSASDTVIEGSLFEGNYCYNGVTSNATNNTGTGGAVHLNGSRARVSNCVFRGNYSANGALSFNETAMVENSLFEGNIAVRNGGALWAKRNTLVKDCSFIGNEARNPVEASADKVVGGSAIYMDDVYSISVVNSTFYGNKNNPSKGATTILPSTADGEPIPDTNPTNVGVIAMAVGGGGSNLRIYHSTIAGNDTNGTIPICVSNRATNNDKAYLYVYNSILANGGPSFNLPQMLLTYPLKVDEDQFVPTDNTAENLLSHDADGNAIWGKQFTDIFSPKPTLVDGRYLNPRTSKATGASTLPSSVTTISGLTDFIANNSAAVLTATATDQRGETRPTAAGTVAFGAIEPIQIPGEISADVKFFLDDATDITQTGLEPGNITSQITFGPSDVGTVNLVMSVLKEVDGNYETVASTVLPKIDLTSTSTQTTSAVTVPEVIGDETYAIKILILKSFDTMKPLYETTLFAAVETAE